MKKSLDSKTLHHRLLHWIVVIKRCNFHGCLRQGKYHFTRSGSLRLWETSKKWILESSVKQTDKNWYRYQSEDSVGAGCVDVMIKVACINSIELLSKFLNHIYVFALCWIRTRAANDNISINLFICLSAFNFPLQDCAIKLSLYVSTPSGVIFAYRLKLLNVTISFQIFVSGPWISLQFQLNNLLIIIRF